jgi:hypothetical protein
LLRGGGGIVRAYRHPLPAPPGGFALDTGRIEAWASHSRPTPSRLLCDAMGRYGARRRREDARPAPPVSATSSGWGTPKTPPVLAGLWPARLTPLHHRSRWSNSGQPPRDRCEEELGPRPHRQPSHRWGMLSPPPVSHKG